MSDSLQEKVVAVRQKLLLGLLSDLQLTGDYHDLMITCQGSEWKVHRAVVCTRSKYFKKACQPGFKEGESLSIDLKDIKPVLVDKLVHYLYNFDYEDEGFLLEYLQQDEDYEANRSGAGKDRGNEEQEGKETLQSNESQRLALHVNMYIIGDRFDLSELKDLAKEKFSAALIERWDKEDLPYVIRTIYENTLPGDRPLRDCLFPTLLQHKTALRSNEDFMDAVKTHGDFAVDLVDAWGGGKSTALPEIKLTSTNPRTQAFGGFSFTIFAHFWEGRSSCMPQLHSEATLFLQVILGWKRVV